MNILSFMDTNTKKLFHVMTIRVLNCQRSLLDRLKKQPAGNVTYSSSVDVPALPLTQSVPLRKQGFYLI